MDEEENKENRFWRIIVLIVIVVLIFLIVGWFFHQEKKRQVIEEKEKKEKRLKEVEERILVLQKEKEKNERIEKFVLTSARILIGVILVIGNFIYKYYYVYPFSLSPMLVFNECILLLYGFGTYISYGTIENFVAAMKSKILHSFRKKHIGSLQELELLIKEKEILIEEISNLEKSI